MSSVRLNSQPKAHITIDIELAKREPSDCKEEKAPHAFKRNGFFSRDDIAINYPRRGNTDRSEIESKYFELAEQENKIITKMDEIFEENKKDGKSLYQTGLLIAIMFGVAGLIIEFTNGPPSHNTLEDNCPNFDFASYCNNLLNSSSIEGCSETLAKQWCESWLDQTSKAAIGADIFFGLAFLGFMLAMYVSYNVRKIPIDKIEAATLEKVREITGVNTSEFKDARQLKNLVKKSKNELAEKYSAARKEAITLSCASNSNSGLNQDLEAPKLVRRPSP